MPYRIQQPPATRRKDASMDALNQILEQPLEPEYAEAKAQGAAPSTKRSRWAVAAVALVAGMMFAISAVQTTRGAPAATSEREQLIAQIRSEEQRQDQLRARAATLREDNATLRERALGNDEQAKALADQLEVLRPLSGDAAVHGPGIVIVVDDAPVTDSQRLDRVLDRDLQELVNGLWYAGAEAISVNGHRLSSLSAIRGAGDAITVDYRSLGRPYRVEAIGDPRTLQARFAESAGGKLWSSLRQNYKMRLDVTTSKSLELPADPSLGLKHARGRQR